jgi:hypothetical protein
MSRLVGDNQHARATGREKDDSVEIGFVDWLFVLHGLVPRPSESCVRPTRIDQLMLFERRDEFRDITHGQVGADSKFAVEFLRNLGCGVLLIEESKNFGADEVEREHPAVPHVQEDRAILRLGFAHVLWDSSHGVLHLLSTESA